MATMTFPLYSPDEIINFLRSHILEGADARSLGRADVFDNPRPDILFLIYQQILQKVRGVRQEHAIVMPFNVDIMYPQIHEGFLPVCSLYARMECLLPICRIDSFQIAQPGIAKAKRTVNILSGFLNFVHFRETRRKVFLELQMDYKSDMEKYQHLKAVNQEATLKVEKLNTVPVEHEAEVKQLTENIRDLQQELRQDCRRKQTALQELASQKKTDIAEGTQKLNGLKVIAATLKEEQEQLKSKVVVSPEELRNSSELMKETIKKLKRSKEEVTRRYEGYRDLVEVLPSCQQEVQLYQKKMEIQGENVERLANVLSEARNLEDQVESAQVEMKKANIDEMSLKRMVTAKDEKLATAEIQIKKLREDTEQHKRAVLEHFNKVQEKRGAVYDKVMAIRKEAKQQKGKIQQLQENTEEKATKVKEIHLHLKAVMEKCHESLLKGVKSYAASRAGKVDEIRRELISIQSSESTF
ncbi:NUF2 protein, partial [Drymodes brunneopygia]|nr:NUF2 protein [Drymodes brunneopygia]